MLTNIKVSKDLEYGGPFLFLAEIRKQSGKRILTFSIIRFTFINNSNCKRLNKIFFGLIVLFSNFCSAQYNYVQNPGFEQEVSCPIMLGELHLSEKWFDPTNASSDYFNSCADISSYCSTPVNLMGIQSPHTGNSYSGIVTYRESNDNFREYICTQLLQPLVAGRNYCVTLYVSLADSCQYATNSIGISFSLDTLEGSIFEPLNATHLNSEEIIDERSGWKKLRYNYVAHGGELFFTIGNFKDYSQMQIIKINNSSSIFNYSYYYIDDVSIYENCNEFEHPNIFTPNNDGINDIFVLDEEQDFIVLNRWGNIVFETTENTKSWDGRDSMGKALNDGIYFLKVINNHKEILYQSYVTILR